MRAKKIPKFRTRISARWSAHYRSTYRQGMLWPNTEEWRLSLMNRGRSRPGRRGTNPRMETLVINEGRGFKFMHLRWILGSLKYRDFHLQTRRFLWECQCLD